MLGYRASLPVVGISTAAQVILTLKTRDMLLKTMVLSAGEQQTSFHYDGRNGVMCVESRNTLSKIFYARYCVTVPRVNGGVFRANFVNTRFVLIWSS